MASTTSNSSNPAVISGSCLCGGIQYEITDQPLKRMLCHCDNCRKATGSSFMANSLLKQSQFYIKTGESLIQRYKDTNVVSGNALIRRFCRVCGSPVYASSSVYEQFVAVTSGTMDGEEARTWKPQDEYYCKSRREYLPVLEETKRLDTL
ncbi:hypothetical protein ASPCADRAFT_210883 [Aspergillus carbonarius ITEM 5010]|uniref:CENP-V/GFA domain-containing protein n=1 Tax=Aspergillus carbonarius (strain ITEM 5010) TaxID=602072 RepID=A0A1R3RAK4_ASPC5|nr:hypothetical protein ASPCADRAFT_210883 [Aspergillus carbonarius ITEM 5010]